MAGVFLGEHSYLNKIIPGKVGMTRLSSISSPKMICVCLQSSSNKYNMQTVSYRMCGGPWGSLMVRGDHGTTWQKVYILLFLASGLVYALPLVHAM